MFRLVSVKPKMFTKRNKRRKDRYYYTHSIFAIQSFDYSLKGEHQHLSRSASMIWELFFSISVLVMISDGVLKRSFILKKKSGWTRDRATSNKHIRQSKGIFNFS